MVVDVISISVIKTLGLKEITRKTYRVRERELGATSEEMAKEIGK